jgi:glucuronate isomerase
MEFIHDDFLLTSKTARRLYHGYAAAEPILDYHSHLSPSDIAADRRFNNLFEIWLEGDHYKWRAMRANGIPERLCTGDAPPFEKFLAWARTVPFALRNPLYHWTHLELKRYFEIGVLLDEASAHAVWDRANILLQSSDLTARGILRKFNVRALCTIDDPCDDLKCHQEIAASEKGFNVFPTFRPDRAFAVDTPEEFVRWVGQLEAASNIEISSLSDFLGALKQRHEYFHALGGRLSDHGLKYCPGVLCAAREASAIFAKARAGAPVTKEETEKFASYLLLFFGRLDTEKGWTKQLHLGALRNVNTRRTRELGVDKGFDGIGDWNQVEALCGFLDKLDEERSLPKTIIYNLNPSDNYAFAAAIGSFQEGPVAGKIQFGSGWWFLDQKEGIEWQLNALSNNGLLSRFIGMLTDSRSFMSFPRHEYFRRVFCSLLGREVENGELPDDEALLGTMVQNVCFRNAQRYLGFGLGATTGRIGAPAAAASPDSG